MARKTPAKSAKKAPRRRRSPPPAAPAGFTKLDTLKRNAFLAAFAQTGNVRRAAEAAECSRQAHYLWLDDPEYARAFQAAQEEAADRLEEEARRRAVEGLKRFKFHAGEAVVDPETRLPYVEHEYSDTLLIFLLKGARPEKYAQRIKTDLTPTPDEFDPGKLEVLRQAGLILIEHQPSPEQSNA